MNTTTSVFMVAMLSFPAQAGQSDVDPASIVHSCAATWCGPVVAAYQQCLADGRSGCEHDRKVKSAHHRALGREPPEDLTDEYVERAAIEMAAREKAYQEYAKELRARQDTEAAEKLRKLPLAKYCSTYGDAVRNQYLDDIGLSPEIIRLTRLEARKRGLRMDDKLIAVGKIKIGLSECNMIASWGIPQGSNRTVTASSIRIQHVYGDFGPYVYTLNSLITSWQD